MGNNIQGEFETKQRDIVNDGHKKLPSLILYDYFYFSVRKPSYM
jgi:hypothetical protein